MAKQKLQMLDTAKLNWAVVGESDGSCQCPGQEAHARHSSGPRTARMGRKEDYAAGARGLSARPDSRAKEAVA